MNIGIAESHDDDREEEIPIPLEDEHAVELRESRERIVMWFERVFHILNAYQSHQESAVELRMSNRVMQYALGFTLAAGADKLTTLARQVGVSKASANKCLLHFESQLRLEPLPGQRKDEGRQNMAKARKAQVADIRACGKLNPNFLK